MTSKDPIRLKKEPLIEAIWEIRFSLVEASAADVLPGMLFQAVGDKYPSIVRLPTAEIPARVAEQDPSLRYAPRIRFDGGNQAVQIGDCVVALSCRRPYVGWVRFSQSIVELAEAVRKTGLIERIDRFSLKYINLIELEPPANLGHLAIELKLADRPLITEPVRLHTVIEENDIMHIVQIVSPAEVILPGDGERRLKGALVDIDSVRVLKEGESWNELLAELDSVHRSCKRMFFAMLKQETLDRLQPEYAR